MNNKLAIIRSHKESYAKNKNKYSENLLTVLTGNEPDRKDFGFDEGEAYKRSQFWNTKGEEDKLIAKQMELQKSGQTITR